MKIHDVNLLSILTNAIGITAKAGRYGGTYAHKDIAYHFGMWISPRFQLLLIKEYQPLQELTPLQVSLVYANEADVLNVALFGLTACGDANSL